MRKAENYFYALVTVAINKKIGIMAYKSLSVAANNDFDDFNTYPLERSAAHENFILS